MAKGIVRKLDELGRITIPIEIRRATGIDVLVPIDLTIENGVLHLRKGSGRRIDELGRYTIPKELRSRYNWETGSELEIFTHTDTVCFRKRGCDWCDNTEDLIDVKGRKLCRSCGEAVRVALEGWSL